MDSIQFGDIKESQPEPELRPDQNAQFVTQVVGKLEDDELPIFVDLDVMRDIEAHAVSDTRVELGGVMLGKQLIDASGNPFVLISESLRAEHYFATKGSFTFTHDTWSEITRRRAEFHPDLQMVGWYHTHPGWNVFLSGMDLFICDNFFNRPLDVALVIDPVNDDRGWFQWDKIGDENENENESPSETVRTGGFILMAGRHRRSELEYFAKLYEANHMSNDPRYSGHGGGQTVQVIESKRTTDLVLLGMLAMQMIFMATIVYWMMTANSTADGPMAVEQQRDSIRQQAQAELLSLVVAGQNDNPKFAEEYAKLKEQEFLLRKNLEGQLAVAQNESLMRKQTQERLESASVAKERYAGEVANLKRKLEATETRLANFSGDKNASLAADDTAYGWGWWCAGVAGLLALGGAGGYVWKASELPPRRQIAASGIDDSYGDFDSEANDDVDYQDPVVPTQVG